MVTGLRRWEQCPSRSDRKTSQQDRLHDYTITRFVRMNNGLWTISCRWPWSSPDYLSLPRVPEPDAAWLSKNTDTHNYPSCKQHPANDYQNPPQINPENHTPETSRFPTLEFRVSFLPGHSWFPNTPGQGLSAHFPNHCCGKSNT